MEEVELHRRELERTILIALNSQRPADIYESRTEGRRILAELCQNFAIKWGVNVRYEISRAELERLYFRENGFAYDVQEIKISLS